MTRNLLPRITQGYLASGSTPGVLQPGESFKVPVYFCGLPAPYTGIDQIMFSLGSYSTDNSELIKAAVDSTVQDWNQIVSEIGDSLSPYITTSDVLNAIADPNGLVNGYHENSAIYSLFAGYKAQFTASPSVSDLLSLRPASITSDAWSQLVGPLSASMGPTWGDFVKTLDANAAYLGNLGENVVDVGALYTFQVASLIGLGPVQTIASATDASIPAPGLGLSFTRAYDAPLPQRDTQGLFGWGWSTPWQASLQIAAGGAVTVLGASGARREFEPDGRHAGAFFSQAGDHGILTLNAQGEYLLTETSGLVTAFHADGTLDYIADTNGNRITAGFTGTQLTSLTHSSGQFLTIAYNAAGLIRCITDSAGRQATFAYDPTNQYLLAATAYDGTITKYTYDTDASSVSYHALTSVGFPDGTHTLFSYDAFGRLAGTSRDGGAEPTFLAYGPAGLVTLTDAAGAGDATRIYYDDRGLPVKSVDPLGDTSFATFDQNFNLTSTTDAAGLLSFFQYDQHGNLVSASNELGESTSFTYGALNRRTSVVDANGNATRFEFDLAGNQTATVFADGSIEQTAFDALGDPESLTNRRGQTSTYSVNAAGQETRQTLADGSHVDFSYDARGNLIAASDGTGTTLLDYDSGDRLTDVIYPTGKSLHYVYDSAGRRVQMTDQSGFTVSYQYDDLGRLSELLDGSGAIIAQYSYDQEGRLARTDNGNGTYTTQQYDAAGDLLHLVNYAPDGSVSSRFDYTYGVLGDRTGEATLDGQWVYSYDSIGELTRALFSSTNPAVPNEDLQYVYDSVGNRVQTIENGATTDYTSNALNQYTTVGSAVNSFDADGNLISTVDGSQVTTYAFDQLNRLTGVSGPGGTSANEYDALGNLSSATRNGQQTAYLTDPTGMGNVVGAYDAAGGLLAHYTYAFGLTSQVDASGNASYYNFDALGSTVGMTSPTGAIENTYSYLPFGQTVASAGTVLNPFGFVGQWGVTSSEPNGLVQMRARFYDPSLGRFTAQDPIGIAGGVNLYSYVSNSPVELIDPSGHQGSAVGNGVIAIHDLHQNYNTPFRGLLHFPRFS